VHWLVQIKSNRPTQSTLHYVPGFASLQQVCGASTLQQVLKTARLGYITITGVGELLHTRKINTCIQSYYINETRNVRIT